MLLQVQQRPGNISFHGIEDRGQPRGPRQIPMANQCAYEDHRVLEGAVPSRRNQGVELGDELVLLATGQRGGHGLGGRTWNRLW